MRRPHRHDGRRPGQRALAGALAAAILGSGFARAASAPTPSPPRSAADPWESARPAVRVFTDRDGLPQNSATALAFDHGGRLWVGTQDGVAIYDGRGFRRVELPEGIHTVHAIVAGEGDTIYLATAERGLARLRGGAWTVFDADHGLPDPEAFALLERDAEGGADEGRELWVGTGGGLARLVGDTWTTFTKVDGLPSATVYALETTVDAAAHRALWAGTAKGLARFDPAAKRWIKVDVPEIVGRVATLAASREHEPAKGDGLWVGGQQGACLLVDGACQETYAKDQGLEAHEIVKLIASPDVHGRDLLRIGTNDRGLLTFRDGGSRPDLLDEARGLPGEIVESLAVTPTGAPTALPPAPPHSVWVGLNSRGLARVELGTWRAIDASMGLASPSVYSVLETASADGGSSFFIGTLAGLARFDPSKAPPPGKTGWATRWASTGLTDRPVLALMQSKRDGALWVGADGGIARVKDGKTTWWREKDGLPGSGLLHLTESTSPSGAPRVWAATQEGMALLEDDRVVRSWRAQDGLPSDVVVTLAETVGRNGDRTLWIGTMLGLASMDERTFAITKHAVGSGPQFIMSFFTEQSGDGGTVLWAGTKSGPYRAEIDEAEATRWESPPAPVLAKLPNLVMNSILRDARGRLYLFTNRGVARLTPRTPGDLGVRDVTVDVWGAEDGLPSSECNTGTAMLDSRGRVWTGTAEGVAIFDPEEEIVDRTPKPLAFERVVKGGVERAAGASAPLAHDRANVSYEFALASFFKETATRYQTQLVGWEASPTDWTADGRREYSNLPAGSYTFRVWGKDSAGNVSGPLTDAFLVRPAPWRTGWAYASYALAVTLLGFGVVRVRERALRARNAELEASVAVRTRELAEKAAALAENNAALAANVELLRVAEQEAEAKARELDRNMSELQRVNDQLVASQVQADRIFSALAEALPGTVLEGKYRLEVKIGAGGFGAVFRATHLALKRPVAVKVFRPTPGNDSAEAVERFRREGEKAALLQHPGAVRVFDAGVSADGIAYMVMEMLVGHTLADELEEKRKLTLERAWQVLSAVADVLAAAHAIGLLHRDIKPSNIFFHTDADGEVVKVVDFGLAKLVGEDSGSEDGPAADLTRTGRILGTPTYMAPERLGSRSSETPSDVYSLGVVVYEMLAGETPFREVGQSLVALLLAHLRDGPPSLLSRRPELPAEVDAAVMAALSADPAARPTADGLATRFAAAAGFTYVKHGQRAASG